MATKVTNTLIKFSSKLDSSLKANHDKIAKSVDNISKSLSKQKSKFLAVQSAKKRAFNVEHRFLQSLKNQYKQNAVTHTRWSRKVRANLASVSIATKKSLTNMAALFTAGKTGAVIGETGLIGTGVQKLGRGYGRAKRGLGRIKSGILSGQGMLAGGLLAGAALSLNKAFKFDEELIRAGFYNANMSRKDLLKYAQNVSKTNLMSLTDALAVVGSLETKKTNIEASLPTMTKLALASGEDVKTIASLMGRIFEAQDLTKKESSQFFNQLFTFSRQTKSDVQTALKFVGENIGYAKSIGFGNRDLIEILTSIRTSGVEEGKAKEMLEKLADNPQLLGGTKTWSSFLTYMQKKGLKVGNDAGLGGALKTILPLIAQKNLKTLKSFKQATERDLKNDQLAKSASELSNTAYQSIWQSYQKLITSFIKLALPFAKFATDFSSGKTSFSQLLGNLFSYTFKLLFAGLKKIGKGFLSLLSEILSGFVDDLSKILPSLDWIGQPVKSVASGAQWLGNKIIGQEKSPLTQGGMKGVKDLWVDKKAFNSLGGGAKTFNTYNTNIVNNEAKQKLDGLRISKEIAKSEETRFEKERLR